MLCIVFPDETRQWTNACARSDQNNRITADGGPEIRVVLNEALNTVTRCQAVEKPGTQATGLFAHTDLE